MDKVCPHTQKSLDSLLYINESWESNKTLLTILSSASSFESRWESRSGQYFYNYLVSTKWQISEAYRCSSNVPFCWNAVLTPINAI